jgi:hypothetical protein
MTIRELVRMPNLALIALIAFATPALASLPDDLREGLRVETEGRRLDDRTISAAEVEVQSRSGGPDEVKGQVTAIDLAKRRITIHGVMVQLNDDAKLEDDDGAALKLSDLSVGEFAEAEGVFRDGLLHGDELERKVPDPGTELEVELIGSITKVDRRGGTFEVLGIDVLVTPRTEIEMK